MRRPTAGVSRLWLSAINRVLAGGITVGTRSGEVEDATERELARFQARIDAVFACGFYPEHPARKPNPGMLLAAAQMLNLDLARSWIIGDHSSDMGAGSNAGLRGGLHVLTGHGMGQREAAIRLGREGFEVRLGDSIADAGPIIEALAG